MKKCPKCGSRLREGSAFCVNCGTRLPGGNFLKQAKRKKSKRIGIVLLFVTVMCSCALFFFFRKEKPEQEIATNNKLLLGENIIEEKQQLLDDIKISEPVYTAVEGDSRIVKIQVELPDYSQILLSVYSEVEHQSSDPESFEQELFAAVLTQTGQSSELVAYDLEINLDDYDPDKENWSEEELNELAQKVAFNEELEQFAINYLLQFSPVFEEG